MATAEKEYIERGALLKELFPYDDSVDPKCYTMGAKMIHKAIKDAPAVDVVDAVEYAILEQNAGKMAAKLQDMEKRELVEVVHGVWTPHEIVAKQAGYSVVLYRHAECPKNPCRLFEAMNDYCPNCGAKMDGKKKYFTPEDVQKMSRSEVHENLDAIIESMKKWGIEFP